MTEPAPTASPKRHRAWTLGAAVLLAAAAGLWWWLAHRPKAPAPAARIDVQVTRAETRAMPVVLQSVGKVVAQASVEVRPQTGGVLRQVFIRDGERVVKGQKLFALDAQPLVATLAQAQAQWVRDKALADDAAAAEARLKPLADKEYVTAREYEQAVSSRLSLQATAAATRTQIDQARIALAYATVAAPISGRAGAVLVKPGSLVTANNATALVVINALSPVDLQFSLPQKLRATGEVVFIDNALSDTSGTITVKARFANLDEALWPGEFYAVRITLKTDEAAVTVPERAVQQGQNGPYAYLLLAGKAVLRPLQVDRVLDGTAVVTSGLKPGDTVLASVRANLRDGAAVQVASPASAASAASAASGPTP